MQVFIDHDKSYYYDDLLVAESKMRPGTVVVADNVVIFAGNDSILKYLARVRDPRGLYTQSTLHEASVEYSPEKDGVEVSIKA